MFNKKDQVVFITGSKGVSICHFYDGKMLRSSFIKEEEINPDLSFDEFLLSTNVKEIYFIIDANELAFQRELLPCIRSYSSPTKVNKNYKDTNSEENFRIAFFLGEKIVENSTFREYLFVSALKDEVFSKCYDIIKKYRVKLHSIHLLENVVAALKDTLHHPNKLHKPYKSITERNWWVSVHITANNSVKSCLGKEDTIFQYTIPPSLNESSLEFKASTIETSITESLEFLAKHEDFNSKEELEVDLFLTAELKELVVKLEAEYPHLRIHVLAEMASQMKFPNDEKLIENGFLDSILAYSLITAPNVPTLFNKPIAEILNFNYYLTACKKLVTYMLIFGSIIVSVIWFKIITTDFRLQNLTETLYFRNQSIDNLDNNNDTSTSNKNNLQQAYPELLYTSLNPIKILSRLISLKHNDFKILRLDWEASRGSAFKLMQHKEELNVTVSLQDKSGDILDQISLLDSYLSQHFGDQYYYNITRTINNNATPSQSPILVKLTISNRFLGDK